MHTTIAVIRPIDTRPMIWRSPQLNDCDIYDAPINSELFDYDGMEAGVMIPPKYILSPKPADNPPVHPSEFTTATVVDSSESEVYAFWTGEAYTGNLAGTKVVVKGYTAVENPHNENKVMLCAIIMGEDGEEPTTNMFLPLDFLEPGE